MIESENIFICTPQIIYNINGERNSIVYMIVMILTGDNPEFGFHYELQGIQSS